MNDVKSPDPGRSGGGIDSGDLTEHDLANSGLGQTQKDPFGQASEVHQELIKEYTQSEIQPEVDMLRERISKQEVMFRREVERLEGKVEDDQSGEKQINIDGKIKEKSIVPIQRSLTRTGIAVSAFSLVISLVYQSPLLSTVSVISLIFLAYSYRNSPVYQEI